MNRLYEKVKEIKKVKLKIFNEDDLPVDENINLMEIEYFMKNKDNAYVIIFNNNKKIYITKNSYEYIKSVIPEKEI